MERIVEQLDRINEKLNGIDAGIDGLKKALLINAAINYLVADKIIDHGDIELAIKRIQGKG